MINGSFFGSYDTRKFADIFPSYSDFETEYKDCELFSYDSEGNPGANTLKITSLKNLYYLLYAAYGNSSVANFDENQFKYKMWSTIFMYGPAWERRLEVQNVLRNLDESELMKGSRQIVNMAANPATEPSTVDTDELSYVNNQNVSKYVRSKIDAYQYLDSVLKTDVSKEFIDKFKKLFIIFVQPQRELYYTVDKEVYYDI